jgi:hypothetical protein
MDRDGYWIPVREIGEKIDVAGICAPSKCDRRS